VRVWRRWCAPRCRCCRPPALARSGVSAGRDKRRSTLPQCHRRPRAKEAPL